jgi:hypothetical protein
MTRRNPDAGGALGGAFARWTDGAAEIRLVGEPLLRGDALEQAIEGALDEYRAGRAPA